jgi:hypothetical protein
MTFFRDAPVAKERRWCGLAAAAAMGTRGWQVGFFRTLDTTKQPRVSQSKITAKTFKDIQRHSKTFKSLKRSLPSKSFWHILFLSNRNHIWGTWILEGPKTIVHLRAETWGSLFFRHRATSSLEFAWCQMPQAGNRFRIYAVASYSVFTSNDVCYSWIQLGNMGLPSSLRIRVPRNPIVNHHFPRICPSPSIFGRSHIFI